MPPPQQGQTLILRRRPPLRKLWCSVWYLCRFCRQFCFQRNSAAPSASRHGIQRPSANAADPFCIWRLHGCRLQNCWLQGFRLQAAGPQAAGLQAAKVGLQAAGWTWAVRGKGLKRCTVAFQIQNSSHLSRASPSNKQNHQTLAKSTLKSGPSVVNSTRIACRGGSPPGGDGGVGGVVPPRPPASA